MEKSDFAKEQVLDVDFETARALHRVVRGMHDGECPSCHYLSTSVEIRAQFGWVCPKCCFAISDEEAQAAMQAFAPVMEKNLAVFEAWRKNLSQAARG